LEDVVFSELNKAEYSLVKVPVIEMVDVFHRSNENADIVMKEFYDFKDKGGRHIALRPELTAPLIRAIVENKLIDTSPLPLRIYSYGPVFRYENPQSGRKRQFNQFDIEIIASNSIYDDIDCILFACKVYDRIGFKGKYFVELNYLGNSDSIKKYTNVLKEYLTPFKDKLSELSQTRLMKNPLRILDDKIDGELDFVKKAPKIIDFLSKEDNEEFLKIQEKLKELKIPFKIDYNMVRGLDYYTNTVFEFKIDGYSSIGAGGRYAKMVQEFGGDDVSCVGLAFSPERILTVLHEMKNETLLNNSKEKKIVVSCRQKEFDFEVLKLVEMLRENDIACYGKYEIDKAAKIFNYAEKANCDILVLFGKKELEQNMVQIIEMKTKKESFVKKEELVEFLKRI
jgi:histidyl-tRNA synthetase